MNKVYQLVEKIKNAKKERKRMVALWVALSVIVSSSVSWSMHSVGSTITKEAICGHEEHQHNEECYQKILTCEIDDEEHIHDESCYTEVLVCGLEEHIHNAECSDNIGVDKETDDIWLLTMPDNLSANWRKNVISIAQSQLGYTESSDNFIFSDDEEKKGYTRYGDWYGNPYGDWNTMFTYFCMNYAGITENDIPYGSGCWAWSEKLIENELLISPDEYELVAGDIIFLDTDNDNRADRTGIITSISETEKITEEPTEEITEEHIEEIAEENESNILITVIEGDFEDSVAETSYFINDEMIFGYLSLENTNMPEQQFDGTTESGIIVYVEAEKGAFPADTIMTVTDISEENVADTVVGKETDVNVLGIVAVDVSFFDKDGNEIEPFEDAGVVVNISLPEDKMLDGEEFRLYHQRDSGEVENISDADVSAGGAVFSAESFSTYVISGVQLDTSPKTAEEGNIVQFNGSTNTSTEISPYIVYPGDEITVSVELERLNGGELSGSDLKAFYTHINNISYANNNNITIDEWQKWNLTYDGDGNVTGGFYSPANIWQSDELGPGDFQRTFTKDGEPVIFQKIYTVPNTIGNYTITYNNCGYADAGYENVYIKVKPIKVQGDTSGKDYSSVDNPYILKVGDSINLIGYSNSDTSGFLSIDCNSGGEISFAHNVVPELTNTREGSTVSATITGNGVGYSKITLFENSNNQTGSLGDFYVKVVQTCYSYSFDGTNWIDNNTDSENPVEINIGDMIWIRRNGSTEKFYLPGQSDEIQVLKPDNLDEATNNDYLRNFIANVTGISHTTVLNNEAVYVKVINPVLMVYTATGWREKDRIHEAMGGTGGNCYDGKYWRNARTGDSMCSPYYILHPKDWVYLTNGDTPDKDISHYKVYQQANGTDELVEVTSYEEVTSSKEKILTPISCTDYNGKNCIKINMPESCENNTFYKIVYDNGSGITDSFWIKFTNGQNSSQLGGLLDDADNKNLYYDHADIEIADGGTYTITSECTNESGQKVVTKRTYSVYVNNIEYCDLMFNPATTGNVYVSDKIQELDAENDSYDISDSLLRITKGEYYRGGSPGNPQYELTSKWQTNMADQTTVNLDDEPVDVSTCPVNNRRLFSQNNVQSATFCVDIYLVPISETITTDGMVTSTNTNFTDADNIIIENTKIELDRQSVIDANNKCPDHSGLDFTVRQSIAIAQAQKTLDGKTPPSDKFTFDLYKADSSGAITNSNPIATVTNTDGQVNFPAIMYQNTGTYYYVINEQQGTDQKIKYDTTTSSLITVNVTESNGDLISEIIYTGGLYTFKNYYYYELPSTGGIGKDILIIFGTGLVTVSVAIYKKRRRKEDI